jgi:hypothetical protein
MKWRARMGRYDVEVSYERAYRPGRPWKAVIRGPGYRWVRLGSVAVGIEDVDARVHARCAACGEPSGDEGVKTVRIGSDVWACCWACKDTEAGVVYVSKRELEAEGRTTW